MYLPFVEKSLYPAMGLKPLALASWIEIDADFASQLSCKTWLLANRYSDVFVAQPGTQAAQQEVLDMLSEHLLQYFPSIYQPLEHSHGICNLRTQQVWSFADFAEAPLDLAARLIQEDLCLMLPSNQGYRLAAASVCFPQRWNLREKLGQPISQIHHHVPEYAQKLAHPVDSLFERLRESHPGLRSNWSLVDSPELYLESGKYVSDLNPVITADNAGKKLWLRVERQTIRRMPISQGVLFSIHSYIYPLAKVTESPEIAAQLSKAILSLKPAMQSYKSLLPFKSALLSYLDARQIAVTRLNRK